jgi:large subunit ribosomal protein L18e
MSISKLAKIANSEEKRSKILTLVGNVLDDERMFDVPKLRVCALKFSEEARKRILKVGGECLTFDQLAKVDP